MPSPGAVCALLLSLLIVAPAIASAFGRTRDSREPWWGLLVVALALACAGVLAAIDAFGPAATATQAVGG